MGKSFIILAIVWIAIPYIIQLISALMLRLDLHFSLFLASIFSKKQDPRTTLITSIKWFSAVSFWVIRKLEHGLYWCRSEFKLWLSRLEKQADEQDEANQNQLEKNKGHDKWLSFEYGERYLSRDKFERHFVELPESNIGIIRSAFLGPASDLADALVFIINTLAFLAVSALVILVGKWSMPEMFASVSALLADVSANVTSYASVDAVKGAAAEMLGSLKSCLTDFSISTDWPVIVLATIVFVFVPVCSHTHITEINLKAWPFYPRSVGRVIANLYSLFLGVSLMELIVPLIWSSEVYTSVIALLTRLGLYLDAVLLLELAAFVVYALGYELVFRPISFMVHRAKNKA